MGWCIDAAVIGDPREYSQREKTGSLEFVSDGLNLSKHKWK